MEKAKHLGYVFWTNPVLTGLLYGALLVHVCLAFGALYRRGTLKLPAPAAIQYIMGFSIPLLAFEHVVGTRVADRVYGADFGYYLNVLTVLFYVEPWRGVLQLALLV